MEEYRALGAPKRLEKARAAQSAPKNTAGGRQTSPCCQKETKASCARAPESRRRKSRSSKADAPSPSNGQNGIRQAKNTSGKPRQVYNAENSKLETFSKQFTSRPPEFFRKGSRVKEAQSRELESGRFEPKKRPKWDSPAKKYNYYSQASFSRGEL